DGLTGILDADSDGDGLPDGAEVALGSDPEANDTDADGLSDGREAEMGTDPTRADTDGDGLADGAEVATGTDPREADTDRDGLSDADEATRGADPWSPDTDGDGLPDGWEVRFGLDPRVAADAAADTDGDGLSNSAEYAHHAWPNATDTDGDLIPDGAEVRAGLDPAANDLLMPTDQDGDGLLGAQEYALGTDPLAPDTDGDGVPDGKEAYERASLPVAPPAWPAPAPRLVALDPEAPTLLSDPAKADTDGDGIDDGRERALWAQRGPDAVRTDYRGATPGFVSNLREADADGHGLDDGQEFLVLGTDPSRPDTDGDGFSDFDEAQRGSDPRDAHSVPTGGNVINPAQDSDGDGLADWFEAGVSMTDPGNPDTDGDGVDDGHEIVAWTTRLHLPAAAIYGYLRDPDVDGDGLSDGEEFATATLPRGAYAPTDPASADSDGDGLTDGQEARNPVVAQSLASLEQAAGRSPFAGFGAPPALPPGAVRGAYDIILLPLSLGAPAARSPSAACRGAGASAPDALDSDGDGLRDGDEAPWGATPRGDPCSPDGDGDQVPDAVEERRVAQTDPDGDGLLPALDADSDGDGLADGAEDADHDGRRGPDETGVLDQDTDDDGLTDATESAAASVTRALDPDSDHDGLPDGLESGLPAPQSSLPAAYGTDPLAQRECGGVAVGPAWLPFLGGGASTPPDNPDADGDGVIDGFEDLNDNGLYGITATGGGDARERLPSGWPELNPGVSDSDADGLLDGEEVGLAARDWFCAQFLRLGGSWSAVADRVGFPAWDRHAVNPHVADTDADGALDALDVDPRSATSVLEIPLTYQQLEPADGLSSTGRDDAMDPWAPDLDLHLSVQVASSTVPLDLRLLDNLHAKTPVNPLSLLDKSTTPSTGGVLWDATRSALRVRLPQGADLYAAAGDPENAIVTIDAIDRDVIQNDVIALSGESSYVGKLQIPLVRLLDLTIETHGTSGQGHWYSLSDPKDAALVAKPKSPFDGFFFLRGLAHAKGAQP